MTDSPSQGVLASILENQKLEETMNGTDFTRPQGLEKPVPTVGFFCDVAMTIEKARVAAQVRLAHLAKRGQTDPDTEELLKRAKPLESFVDGKLGDWVLLHPTAKWWRRISGMPTQLMGKVIGCVDQFGRWYPEGDPWIPPSVTREPETDEQGQRWVWVEGIERFTTPSKLFKYAGMMPGQRRSAGKLLDYNAEFRTILYRLMQFGFMFNRNRYYEHYDAYKSWKMLKLVKEGIRVLPTPRGRFCAACQKEYTVKDALYCPVCNTKLGKKEEPAGIIWAGHLDFMARRRAIKLFLSHFWGIYREAKNLPLRTPYPVEYLGHSQIVDPWDMCDLDEGEVQELAATA